MKRSHIGSGVCIAALLLVLAGAGCQPGAEQTPLPDPRKRGAPQAEGTIFGDDGIGSISLFGGGSTSAEHSGIGVNSYLWRASLDTIAFMPLLSADPFGGVIITDWYILEGSPDERFKMTVYIRERALRADGVQVAVFRQERVGGGEWEDRPTSQNTAVNLENKILERARQLHTSSLGE